MRRTNRVGQRIFGVGSSWRNNQYANRARDKTPSGVKFDFLGAVHQKKLDSFIASNDMVSAMASFQRLVALRCQITLDSYEKLINKLSKEGRLDDLDNVLSESKIAPTREVMQRIAAPFLISGDSSTFSKYLKRYLKSLKSFLSLT